VLFLAVAGYAVTVLAGLVLLAAVAELWLVSVLELAGTELLAAVIEIAVAPDAGCCPLW
jgi:hypothetical protein